MSTPPVSIHPYFKAHPGQLSAIRPLLSAFVDQTRSEPGVLFYEFTINGDEIFCREAYRDAEAVQAHLANVEAHLAEMQKWADLIRIEFHGPEDQIAKLRPQLTGLNASYYSWVCGLDKW